MGRLGLWEAQPPGLETSEGWAWGSAGEGGYSGRPPLLPTVALRPSPSYLRTPREVIAPCLMLGGSSALGAGRKQIFFTSVFFEKWKAMPCNGTSTTFNYRRKQRPFLF